MIMVLYDRQEADSSMELMKDACIRIFHREDILFWEDCTRCLEPVDPDKKQELYEYVYKGKVLVEEAEEVYLYQKGRCYRIK